jgi:outer membrane protein OmpA-like peptidoglycan-associated protein
MAQNSGKSKSKDRLREKDERRYPVTIKNCVGINTPHIEFGPAFYDGGLMFVTSQDEKGPRDDKDEPFTQFYFAVFDPNGDPVIQDKFFFDEGKKSGLYDGPLCFTRDMKTAYYTRTNNRDGVRKAARNQVAKNKIYETHKDSLDPDWFKPIDLPLNDDNYNCVHPSLSPDGTKLFFASDKLEGSYGGYDLYVVDREDNGNGRITWGKPRNLGPNINTDRNDIYPFISYQGTLFYSSNGRSNSLGNYDLYYVNNPLTNPEEVVNMNAPFNSEGDDKNIILDADGKSGFFVSNRAKGYGQEDIYRFSAPRGLEGIGKPEVNKVAMSIKDAKTGEPIQNASIRILQPTNDGFLGNDGPNDFYKMEIAPVENKKNVLSFQLVRKDAADLGKPGFYSNVSGEAKTEFNRYRTYLVIVSLDGYRTQDRLVSVEDEKDISLDFDLREAPLCFRAGGIVLSTEFGTRITNAVVKLVHKITGEEVTVRTTSNGEFDACLPVEGDYVGYVEREGFNSASFRFSAARGKRASEEVLLKPIKEGGTIEQEMPLANGLQDGSVIIMEKIFYEYNKATLNQYAVRNLEALYELLIRYPEMEIDINVHTDTRGESALNQELTDERAKNSKTYLTYRGIQAERIRAFGKGESEPRNRCTEGVECSDEEHQQNNRLEILVRKLGSPLKP